MPLDDPSASFRQAPDSRATMYWLDIDVTFRDITRQQRILPSRLIVRRAPPSFQHSVLHGVGEAANALSVGDAAKSFDRFRVDVAALETPNDEFGLPQLHRSARMVWNEVDVDLPRLQIRVQVNMLRRLVELYVTKRIDTVLLSMKIEVERQAFIQMSPRSDLLPTLDNDGRLYFRRTQCELLSVRASLSGEHKAAPSS